MKVKRHFRFYPMYAYTVDTFKKPPVCMTLALFRSRPSVHHDHSYNNNKARFHGRWLATKHARFITGNRPSGCCIRYQPMEASCAS